MTDIAPSGAADVVVSRMPDGDGSPAALAAARLFAELGDPGVEVVVHGDAVTFRGVGAELRARVVELLGEPRFAGWELRAAGAAMT